MNLPWEIWLMILKQVRKLKFLHYRRLIQYTATRKYPMTPFFHFSLSEHGYNTVIPGPRLLYKAISPGGIVTYVSRGRLDDRRFYKKVIVS